MISSFHTHFFISYIISSCHISYHHYTHIFYFVYHIISYHHVFFFFHTLIPFSYTFFYIILHRGPHEFPMYIIFIITHLPHFAIFLFKSPHIGSKLFPYFISSFFLFWRMHRGSVWLPCFVVIIHRGPHGSCPQFIISFSAYEYYLSIRRTWVLILE